MKGLTRFLISSEIRKIEPHLKRFIRLLLRENWSVLGATLLKSRSLRGPQSLRFLPRSSSKKSSSFSDLDAISMNLVSDLLESDLKQNLEEQVRSLTQDDLPSFSALGGRKDAETKTDNTKLTDHTLDTRPFAEAFGVDSLFSHGSIGDVETAATYASLPILSMPAQEALPSVALREQSLDDAPFDVGSEPAGSSDHTLDTAFFQESTTSSAKVGIAAVSLDDAVVFERAEVVASDTIAQMDVLGYRFAHRKRKIRKRKVG